MCLFSVHQQVRILLRCRESSLLCVWAIKRCGLVMAVCCCCLRPMHRLESVLVTLSPSHSSRRQSSSRVVSMKCFRVFRQDVLEKQPLPLGRLQSRSKPWSVVLTSSASNNDLIASTLNVLSLLCLLFHDFGINRDSVGEPNSPVQAARARCYVSVLHPGGRLLHLRPGFLLF